MKTILAFVGAALVLAVLIAVKASLIVSGDPRPENLPRYEMSEDEMRQAAYAEASTAAPSR